MPRAAGEAVRKLEAKIERVNGGIVMLGSSAGGKWRCEVGGDSVINKEAEGRTRQAVEACGKLRQLAELRLVP
eukprot:9227406-Lingulodinium_polyedra.AAC.1